VMMVPGHCWPGELDAAARTALRRRVDALGAKIVTLNMPNIDMNVAGIAPEMRSYTIGLLKGIVELAGDLGVPGVVVGPGKANPLFPAPRERLIGYFFEALDVLAPRNTPVLAVEDGTVARLFLSDAGGITIYQFDPTTTFVYYYAHLERYAEGLKEGASITRGQVIGYVGTTGNAPRDTPHLHFAIFQMTEEKKWWEGTVIDPYSVLK